MQNLKGRGERSSVASEPKKSELAELTHEALLHFQVPKVGKDLKSSHAALTCIEPKEYMYLCLLVVVLTNAGIFPLYLQDFRHFHVFMDVYLKTNMAYSRLEDQKGIYEGEFMHLHTQTAHPKVWVAKGPQLWEAWPYHCCIKTARPSTRILVHLWAHILLLFSIGMSCSLETTISVSSQLPSASVSELSHSSSFWGTEKELFASKGCRQSCPHCSPVIWQGLPCMSALSFQT